VRISSSAIVTKILIEMHRLTNRETRLILGIVVVEDLFLAVYLAALQPVLALAAPILAAQSARLARGVPRRLVGEPR
jgi:CPA2 family monovalent cation:H+ antiporter-2